MIISSSAKHALGATAILAILAGCSTGSQSAYTPAAQAGPAAFRPNTLPRPMLYVGSWTSGEIFGYNSPRSGHANKKNGPPACTFGTGVRGLQNIASDAQGDLIVPSYSYTSATHLLDVFGPNCGSLMGTITNPYGATYDEASANALTGKIVLATSSTYTGSVAVCTLSGGCTTDLSIPDPYSGQNAAQAVTLDRAGDCWAQAVFETSSKGNIYALIYYKGCSGTGQIATGFLNTFKGGLNVDKHGNIVSIDAQGDGTHGELYVYKGCKPACTLVGGPFTMFGDTGEYFGRLDKAGNTFATMDFFVPQVNVYHYTPTALTYLYSFNNGLSSCGDCTGIAFGPAITK